jgi:hypothetical protein
VRVGLRVGAAQAKSEHDYGEKEQEAQRDAPERENAMRLNSINSHGFFPV